MSLGGFAPGLVGREVIMSSWRQLRLNAFRRPATIHTGAGVTLEPDANSTSRICSGGPEDCALPAKGLNDGVISPIEVSAHG